MGVFALEMVGFYFSAVPNMQSHRLLKQLCCCCCYSCLQCFATVEGSGFIGLFGGPKVDVHGLTLVHDSWCRMLSRFKVVSPSIAHRPAMVKSKHFPGRAWTIGGHRPSEPGRWFWCSTVGMSHFRLGRSSSSS